MGIAGQSAVADARTLYETLSGSALQQLRSNNNWEAVARRYDGADGASIEITHVGAVPVFEELKGDAAFGGFRKLTQSMPLKTFSKQMDLQRTSVIYDRNGSTQVAITSFLRDLPYLYDKIVYDLVATNPTVLDGTALIASSHNFGTFNNRTTDDLSFASFDAGRAALQSQTDEFGEFLDVDPDILVVHPDELRTAQEIVGSELRPVSVSTAGALNGAAGGSTVANVYAGAGWRVVSTPRMTTGDWLMNDSRYPPIALGVWMDPAAYIMDDFNSEEAIKRDRLLYQVKADVNAMGLTHLGTFGKMTGSS